MPGEDVSGYIITNDTLFHLYTRVFDETKATTIDNAADNICPLLAKGENAINKELTDLASLNPGQLDQSRLLSAQMNLSRWQLASQLLSNFIMGVSSGLKNTVSNVGR